MLAEHTKDMSEEQKRAILSENAAELYGIDLSAL
jgi:predicted TIM-barrel fold metal-dependent hydrolase